MKNINQSEFYKLKSFSLVQSSMITSKLSKVLIYILLFIFLCLQFVPWQQTSMGRGKVIAYSPTDRKQSIDATVDGRLGTWFVREGTKVKEGDPIVEIFDNDPDILIRLKSERDSVLARLQAAKISIKTAEINMSRQKKLADVGLSSQRSYELAQLEYAKFLTDQANSQVEITKIESRLARQSTQFVKASRNGTIFRRISGDGSTLVKAGESIAEIVPDVDSRAVELWIAGNDVALLKEGLPVRIRFEGWPAIQFSGWPSIAVGTFGGHISVIDAADNGKGDFRVLVTPDHSQDKWPSGKYLRQGARAQGWIILGKVRLGYELWRKINAFPPTVAPPSEDDPDEKK